MKVELNNSWQLIKCKIDKFIILKAPFWGAFVYNLLSYDNFLTQKAIVVRNFCLNYLPELKAKMKLVA